MSQTIARLCSNFDDFCFILKYLTWICWPRQALRLVCTLKVKWFYVWQTELEILIGSEGLLRYNFDHCYFILRYLTCIFNYQLLIINYPPPPPLSAETSIIRKTQSNLEHEKLSHSSFLTSLHINRESGIGETSLFSLPLILAKILFVPWRPYDWYILHLFFIVLGSGTRASP